MKFIARKFYVWLISLGAVFVIYLLYSWVSETPQIPVDTEAEFTHTVAESNVGEFGGEIATIGDVGLETVKVATFRDLNREFGFEELLHDAGDEWELEKPFMNIFQRDFKCYITADKGRVRVEEVLGRPNPTDAKLAGNVVIHILPEGGSDIEESFIYLDDVVFISEKSQFSTAGPVKFISQNAQMLGTGLELVYNSELDRLEFLRIIHLESLCLKTSSSTSLFSPAGTEADRPAAIGVQAKTQQSDRPAVAYDSKKERTAPEPRTQIIEQKQDEYYRWVFSKNVVIDTPGQLIYAADEFSINNILRSKDTSKKSGKADSVDTDSVEKRSGTVAEPPEPNESDEQLVNIVVTCDNGIVVTPMDSPRTAENSAKLGIEPAAADSKGLKKLENSVGRTTFAARRIDYCAVADEVTFEGNCLCTMFREGSGIQRRYTLSAPKIVAKLSGDKAGRSSDSAGGIEHLTASGGVVKLAAVKTAAQEPAKGWQNDNPEKVLAGIELKCFKFDYDNSQQMFMATGPALIKVDNSGVSRRPDAELGRFSLQRPCYALVRNFETLKYYLQANQIIADAGPQEMLVDYFPIVEGQYGQHTTLSTARIETLLYETAAGQTELSTLSATGGITYEDEDNQFEGSRLFYDAGSSMMTVQGDKIQSCYLNGALVDAIEYDLRTDQVKAKITGPGALQMK